MPTAGAASDGAQSETPELLRFTAKTVDGSPFDAATLVGTPVVFWFWAAWCPRCAAAAGDVAAVQRDVAGRASIVGVAGLGSGEDAMRSFVNDFDLDGFVNLADDQGTVWRRFGVTAQEYYVILDKSGTLVHKGPLTPTELRDQVAALVG